MALLITPECIGCGVCLPDCPNQAICEKDGEFWIRAGLCTECIDVAAGPHCQRLCPIKEAIVVNPARVETPQQLQFKAKRNALKRFFEQYDKKQDAA